MIENSYLFEMQDALSVSGKKSIGAFMVAQFGIDYDDCPMYVELEKLLTATMRLKVENNGVYYRYTWIDADL